MNPDAIEAAAKAIHHYDIDKLLTTFPVPTKHHRAEAEAALEAAAPYLIREARAAELYAAADDITESAQIIAVRSHDTGVDNGQTLHAMTTDSDWLRARAAAIRAGEAE